MSTKPRLRFALPLFLAAALSVVSLVPPAPVRAQDQAAAPAPAGPLHPRPEDPGRPPDHGRRAPERPPLLDPREPGAEEPGRAAPGRQRRLGPRGRGPARPGPRRRAPGLQRHDAFPAAEAGRLHAVDRHALRLRPQRLHQLRRDDLRPPDPHGFGGHPGQRVPHPRGLGPQRDLRPQGHRQGAGHHRRGVAARPGRRGPDARQADPHPPGRLALRRAPARREEGGHRDLRPRHPEALLPDLVPAEPHGRRRRGRFRQGPHRGAGQEALRAPDQPARRPGPSELSGAGPRRDVLRHHPGQGGVPERRGRLSQAPRGRPEHGRLLPPDARRAALQRYVQRPAHRDRPEARSAVPRRRLEPGAVRRLQGRLRPLGPRR